MKMRKIRLYGSLRRFGREFVMDVATPADAVHALCELVPGFRQAIHDLRETGLRVLVGNSARDENTAYAPMGDEVIRLVPVVSGAEKSPALNIIIGVALIIMTQGGASSVVGEAWGAGAASAMSGIGWSMVIGGVAGLLTSPPMKPVDGSNSDSRNYTFSGPVVTTGQGNPVPVLLGGPLRIGGALISAGLDGDAWTTKGLGGQAPDEVGTRGGNGDTSPWVWAIKPA